MPKIRMIWLVLLWMQYLFEINSNVLSEACELYHLSSYSTKIFTASM